jgi:hypothetical protein
MWRSLLALIVVAQAATPADRPKDVTIGLVKQLFGAQIQTPQFFDVDRFRVLRLVFDSNGRLTEVAVEPKFYFTDLRPDWEAPPDFDDMTAGQFKDVLDRFDRLWPKGALKKPKEGLSFVTNSLAQFTEEYERATITWAELVDLRRGEKAAPRFRFVKMVLKR